MATLSVPPPDEREQTTTPPPPRLTAYGSAFAWGAVLLLLVGLLTYVIVGFGVDHFTDADAARVLERQKILADRNAEDFKYLHDKPGWFKKDAGLVRVPIDEAMAMTLPALQAAKPHPAYPIAQSPPQNSAAPTSPDKGAGQDVKTPGKTNDNNPSASNPTLTPATPTPAPTPTATPAPTVAPTPAPAPATPTPAPTVAPTPTATAAPASNPGPAPVPGAQPQPSAPPAETNTSGVVVPAATPAPTASGAQAAPLTNPPAQPTPETANPPAPASTPIPNPQTPGASPAGTP